MHFFEQTAVKLNFISLTVITETLIKRKCEQDLRVEGLKLIRIWLRVNQLFSIDCPLQSIALTRFPSLPPFLHSTSTQYNLRLLGDFVPRIRYWGLVDGPNWSWRRLHTTCIGGDCCEQSTAALD